MFLQKLIRQLQVIFITGCFFFFPSQAYAAGNFTTDYKITYTIDETGVAHAMVNGSLTNTTSQFYASSYKMQVGFATISNVQAQDPGGPIQPVVSKNNDGYVIDLTFNQKALGLGSKQDFVIMFDTPTLARHYGKIWEINIPGIANPNDFSSFVVELKTPASFGQPAYIKPKQSSNALVFSKETLGKSGISIAFGDKQIYKFLLTYHLRNPNLYPVTTEIALPPTTNYQDVFINNMDPKPTNVTRDADGNWLAQYRLTSAQKMEVLVEGNAEIRLRPKEEPLTPQQLSKYTVEQKYWETSNDKIRELADGLRTPEAIYLYVVDALKYDFTRVTQEKPRLGALGALNKPNSAVCREFTDLFIALARAAGIPAREVDGYAYTENAKQRPLSLEKDILHVWPEYYDSEKKTWIMVDPTWGSTTGGIDYFETLDFDHLAFAIKGQSSTYPITAGGYKYTDQKASKDVRVEFTTSSVLGTNTFETKSTIPQLAIAGLPIKGRVTVKNTGTAYIPPQILYLSSNTFLPGTQTIATEGIPPYGQTELHVGFKPTKFLTNTNGEYTIRVAGVSTVKSVKSAPFFLTPLGGGSIIGILAIIIFIFAGKSGRLRLPRRG